MTYLRTGGYVSTLNSTTTPLAIAGTYTGTWERVGSQTTISVIVKSDVSGVLYVDFSSDGINIDRTVTFNDGLETLENIHAIIVISDYFRIRVINDGFAQTYMRLQTIINNQPKIAIPTTRASSHIDEHTDVLMVRGGSDFKYDIALNRVNQSTTWNKWGYNADVDSGAEETIWSPGGNLVPMTTAATLDLYSSDANDTNGGTGANNVYITGIDGDWNEVEEVVLLNGTTAVTTANTYLGIRRMSVGLFGTSETNAGTITAETTVGANIQSEIPAGDGTSQSMIFFSQADHSCLIDWMLLNVIKDAGGSDPKVTFKMWVCSSISNGCYEVFRHSVDVSLDNTLEFKPSQPFVVGEKSRFWITADSDQNNTAISARLSFVEVSTHEA